ncbi:2Fe-2S iron-sulfur cluster-binding protein [Pseudaquidulcibacter saccharophilus]|uniref:2Fe-2S iron-sulfur cluster-binding protein n=1 Tax=Pseudaquidulcibacter saccharophilus TaxID=2831900 RepID=UPI001EFF1F94|nr:2Fe-2S iron-sulfur cluster-binding protein [Pseudaquidulcibacter saccharophilus]
MSEQRFNIDVENINAEFCGSSTGYADERVLVSLERAQGFGKLKNLPKRLPVGCRRGGCGICRARILEGNYKRDPMSREYVTLEDEKEGLVLLCAIYPLSDLKVRLEPKCVKNVEANSQSLEI